MSAKLNSIITLSILLSTISSFAGPFVSGGDPTGDLICINKAILDGHYSTIFHNIFSDREKVFVSLLVPNGETSAESFDGNCTQNEDTTEIDLQCSVVANNTEAYWVTITVDKNKKLVATANKVGTEDPQSLPDCHAE